MFGMPLRRSCLTRVGRSAGKSFRRVFRMGATRQIRFGSEGQDDRSLGRKFGSVNRAYAVSDRISLRALDELVWSAITLFKVFLAKGEVVIPLADGSRLCFQVHPFWRSLPHDRLRPSVKTVDLKSAYKQLAVSPADRCLSIVTVKEPATGRAVGFESRTLLFGATSSVVSFNRVARLIQRVLIALQVLSCNYESHRGAIVLYCFCVKRLRCRNRQPNCLKPLLL